MTLIVFFGLMGASAVAKGVERRLDAAADGTVTITNTAGSVTVTGWSRKEVEVTGDLGSGVEELLFERDGKDVVVTVKGPKRGGRNIASDLKIKVPEKSSVKVAGVSSDIDVTNVFGTLHLQSVSGDIDAEVHGADVEITTVSGDIDVRGDNKKGHAELSSVSGDIDVQNLAGDVTVGSVSGDLGLIGGTFDRLSLETTNGDMTFKGKLSKDGTLTAETINGDVDIDFQGGVSARFDIETFNGDVRNCFGPKPVRTSKYTPGTELKFSEGNGAGRVALKTLNGDVRICKD